MLPFYLLWLIIALFSNNEIFISQNKYLNKSLKLLAFYVIFFYLIIFTVFKGNVGADYNSYMLFFNLGKFKDYKDTLFSIEPLFWYLSRLFFVLNLPFECFWFLLATITLILKFRFYKNMSPYLTVSLLIYLSGMFIERDFDGIRQGLSISFCYIGILALLRSNKKEFLIYCLIGILFHYSSVVFLISPFFLKIRMRKFVYYVILMLGFIFVLMRLNFLVFVVNFIPLSYLKAKVNVYMSINEYSKAVGINIGILVRIMIFTLFIIKGNRFGIDDEKYNLLLNGLFFSIICFLFFNNMDILAHRLAYGFREFQIIIIPMIFKKIKAKEKPVVYSFIIVYSFVMFYRMINTPLLRTYYQYTNLLFNF
ncbi:EpsG family protein [Treponema parvum]|uniref:EpsG family protein n=1 Tax=Treponema parvum TaxID=138851 RepID=A0A975IF18_9SPIR|nr:EpsG family protein [Treponema parvum]QTQ14521.1 EpsG family protein [Treponema parvum]